MFDIVLCFNQLTHHIEQFTLRKHLRNFAIEIHLVRADIAKLNADIKEQNQAQIFQHSREKFLQIHPFFENGVQPRDNPRRLAFLDFLHKFKIYLSGNHAKDLPNLCNLNLIPAIADGLIQERKRISHPAICLTRNEIQ